MYMYHIINAKITLLVRYVFEAEPFLMKFGVDEIA